MNENILLLMYLQYLEEEEKSKSKALPFAQKKPNEKLKEVVEKIVEKNPKAIVKEQSFTQNRCFSILNSYISDDSNEDETYIKAIANAILDLTPHTENDFDILGKAIYQLRGDFDASDIFEETVFESIIQEVERIENNPHSNTRCHLTFMKDKIKSKESLKRMTFSRKSRLKENDFTFLDLLCSITVFDKNEIEYEFAFYFAKILSTQYFKDFDEEELCEALKHYLEEHYYNYANNSNQVRKLLVYLASQLFQLSFIEDNYVDKTHFFIQEEVDKILVEYKDTTIENVAEFKHFLSTIGIPISNYSDCVFKKEINYHLISYTYEILKYLNI